MTITIKEFGPGTMEGRSALQYIATHMRSADIREARLSGTTPLTVTKLVADNAPRIVVAYLDDIPAFAFGTWQMAGWLGQVWGFGTEFAPEVMSAVTKYTIRHFLPGETARGIRRLELRLPADHWNNIHWIKFLGGKFEGYLTNYGPAGEDFVQMSLSMMPRPSRAVEVSLAA